MATSHRPPHCQAQVLRCPENASPHLNAPWPSDRCQHVSAIFLHRIVCRIQKKKVVAFETSTVILATRTAFVAIIHLIFGWSWIGVRSTQRKLVAVPGAVPSPFVHWNPWLFSSVVQPTSPTIPQLTLPDALQVDSSKRWSSPSSVESSQKADSSNGEFFHVYFSLSSG